MSSHQPSRTPRATATCYTRTGLVAALAWLGACGPQAREDTAPVRHKEQLAWESVKPSVRSYK